MTTSAIWALSPFSSRSSDDGRNRLMGRLTAICIVKVSVFLVDFPDPLGPNKVGDLLSF